MSFSISIFVLSLVQAALVALPRLRPVDWAASLRNPWWAAVPAGSIVVVVAVVALSGAAATGLAYLALLAVPPLAALALGSLLHGSRPAWALGAVPLFAVAWAASGTLAGEASAVALSGLACIALAWLLVAVVPARWLPPGIYAMAAIDAALVAAELLQGPSGVLSAAGAGDLPRLQVLEFGAARTGFGDAFVAATVGCLLAVERRRQLRGAALVVVFALAFDLLFFAFDTLPATVPVALALAALEWRERDDRNRRDGGGAQL